MDVLRTLNPNLFIKHKASLSMFEPEEESVVLEIVCSILDISADEMMKIGETTKKIIIFDPSLENEDSAVEKLKDALKDMSKEEAVVAGMFISGLLRCNLAEQYTRAMAESVASEETDRRTEN